MRRSWLGSVAPGEKASNGKKKRFVRGFKFWGSEFLVGIFPSAHNIFTVNCKTFGGRWKPSSGAWWRGRHSYVARSTRLNWRRRSATTSNRQEARVNLGAIAIL